MTIDRSVKIGIVTSIVATFLFIYFLNPILTLFGYIIVYCASHLYSGYVNHLYEKAALCTAHDYSYVLLGFLMSFVCGCSLGFYGFVFNYAMRKKKGLSPPQKPFSPRLLRGKNIFFVIIITLLVNFLAILMLWDGWFRLKVISSFQQHMKTVAPYLDEQEEENLWSEWTQMRSVEDYTKIYARLKSVAEENGLRLPENKAYSIKSL